MGLHPGVEMVPAAIWSWAWLKHILSVSLASVSPSVQWVGDGFHPDVSRCYRLYIHSPSVSTWRQSTPGEGFSRRKVLHWCGLDKLVCLRKSLTATPCISSPSTWHLKSQLLGTIPLPAQALQMFFSPPGITTSAPSVSQLFAR